jgi:hypothetical protein
MARNPYRFSRRFIAVATGVLIALMFVLPVVGIALGYALGDEEGDLTIVLAIAGFGLPLVAAAVLGGESIRRGAGVVGLLLAAGLIAGPIGVVAGIRWLIVIGVVLVVAGGVLFWVIGFKAKVPMWIGLPGAKVRSWNDPSDPGGTTYT